MAPTVLIIESDEQSASQLARAFDAAGFAVSHSAEPEDAWRRIERGKPRIVVLCAELPGAGGYRLCKKIKTSASTSTIPVFLTSSTASAEVFDLHSKRAYRAEAYFRKPVRPEAVAAHAATLVGGIGDSDAEVRLDDLIGDLGEAPAASREIDTRNVDAVSELARRKLPQDATISTSPPAVPSATGGSVPVTDAEPGAGRTLEPVELTSQELALLHDETDDVEGSGEAMDEGQTDVRDMTEMFGRAAEAAATRQLHDEIERLSGRVGELETAQAGTLADLASARERVRAREEELEVLRGSHQSGARMSAATSERELLTVREALSAKEREVLDLRDERHAKEREAIGLRDQLGALTEQLREHNDELGDVRARLGAAEEGRDQALERARASEAALSTAQNEGELRERAAMADLAALNRRLESTGSELAAAQSALSTSETDAESSRQAVAELRMQLSEAQTLAAQNEARWESENERATAASSAADALTAEIASLRASSSAALSAAESEAQARVLAVEHAAVEQVEAAKVSAAAELAASTAAAEAQLATLRTELADVNRQSANEVQELRETLAAAERASQAAAAEHNAQLVGVEAAAATQLSALRAAQEQANSAADARREALREELEASSAEALNSLAAEHAVQLEAQRSASVRLTEEHRAELDAERALREEASVAHTLALSAAEAQLDELRHSLEALASEKEAALMSLVAEHDAALSAATLEHQVALESAAAQASAALETARVASEHVAQQLQQERDDALAEQAEHHQQQHAALQLALTEEIAAERAERAEASRQARAAAEKAIALANERGAALLAAAAAEERRAGLVIASLLRDVQAVTDSETALRERVATSERALAALLTAARAAEASLSEDPVESAERGAGEALIEWQTGRQALAWSALSLEVAEAAEPTVSAEDTAEVDLSDAAEASGYASSGLPVSEEESLEEWVEPTEVDAISLSGVVMDSAALPGAVVESDGLSGVVVDAEALSDPAVEIDLSADDDSELPVEVSFGEGPSGAAAGTAETQQISDPDMLSAVQAAQSVRQAADTTDSMIESDGNTQGLEPDPAPKRAKQNTTVEVGVNAHAHFEEPDFVIQRQPSFDLTDADERVELSESGVPITYVEASGRGDTEQAVSVGSTTSMGAPGDAVAEARARGAAFEREPTRNDVELVDVEDRFVVEQLSDLSSMDDAMVDLNEDEIDEDDFV